MLQHIVTVRPVITETHIFDPERPLFREPVRFQGKRLFLILFLVYFAQTFQLIFASWNERAKPINCSIGAVNCPTIYVSDIIIPNVISPETTARAAKKEIRILVVWLKNTDPSCWYCCRAKPLMLILNSFTWMRSHSHRFSVSQLFSLISCMPVTNWKRLLCSPAACANRLMSSSRPVLHKGKYPGHIQAIAYQEQH